jgi:hypothetical protein
VRSRLLDFPQAGEYVSAIGHTVGADGALLDAAAITQLLQELKHSGPTEVLTTVRALTVAHPELPELVKPLAYLEQRAAQMQYPTFRAEGWPIGSGSVESANKLVVEDRLKGAGMHWERQNVNPMVAVRNAVCTDRWDEVWGEIEGEQRQQVAVRRQARRWARTAAPVPAHLSEAASCAQVYQAPSQLPGRLWEAPQSSIVKICNSPAQVRGATYVLILLANWLAQVAVGLKALGYSYKGRLRGLATTRYRISPAVSCFRAMAQPAAAGFVAVACAGGPSGRRQAGP